MSTLTPILALEHVLTQDPEVETDDYRIAYCPERSNTLLLYVSSDENHILEVSNIHACKVEVQLSVPNRSALPEAYAAALAALGATASTGTVLQTDGTLLDHRLAAVDHAFVLLNRITRWGVTPEDAVATTRDLLQLAAGLRSIRDAIFEIEQSAKRIPASLITRMASLKADLATFIKLQRIPKLQKAYLHEDPRGTICTLDLGPEHGQFDLVGLSVDWACSPVDEPPASIGTGRFAIRPSKLEPAIAAALQHVQCTGRAASIKAQLKPDVFAKVSAFLRSLGGVWHTGQQAHIFEQDAAQLLRPALDTGYVFTRKDYECFQWACNKPALPVKSTA